jgi:hydrogenase/urease accessory protein HupE
MLLAGLLSFGVLMAMREEVPNSLIRALIAGFAGTSLFLTITAWKSK